MNTLLFLSNNREVYLDDEKLSPGPSLAVINHSPDGFAWGYPGSGPAQLALAICLRFLPKQEALEKYQQLKSDFIAALPQGITEVKIDLPAILNGSKKCEFEIVKNEPDDSPIKEWQKDWDYSCSKGWADRCARSLGKHCTCQCGGHNHGKAR